jgi:hypothetical protein
MGRRPGPQEAPVAVINQTPSGVASRRHSFGRKRAVLADGEGRRHALRETHFRSQRTNVGGRSAASRELDVKCRTIAFKGRNLAASVDRRRERERIHLGSEPLALALA